jgi:hypothetical protein
MADPRALENLRKDVEWWSSQFRVLRDWTLSVEEDPEYDCRVGNISIEERKATILTCQGLETDDCDEHGIPAGYALHEVLHVAMKAAVALGPKDGEEILIQDIVELLLAQEKNRRKDP